MHISSNLIPPLSALPVGADINTASANAAQVEQTAEAFEGMFASLLIKEMRKTLPEGMFGSEQSDIYGGMFDEYVGKHLAESGGLGIKQLLLSHGQSALSKG